MGAVEQIVQSFRCPDDGRLLRPCREALGCEHCGRRFPTMGPRIFELKALTPKAVNSTVQSGYEAIHSAELTLDDPGPGWGDLGSINPGRRQFVKRERATIAVLLGDKSRGVVVDVSGGVGNYSSSFADGAEAVIHCELHVPSFAQACRDHGQRQNMFFVRSDYLALPLADGIADGAVCTDTLIRGVGHEQALFAEIRRILKPDGRAVVDFQHFRFRCIQKRSPLQKLYELNDFLRLVAESGLAVERVQGIGYVPTRTVPWEWTYGLLDRLFKVIVPPSRYLLILTHR